MNPSGSVAGLIERQRSLAARVISEDRLELPPRRVAAVDSAFPENGRITRSAAVLARFPSLEIEGESVCERPTEFPYIPGLLSFRELPAVLEALDGLPERPDLVLCDGQGLAHPRRFGIACHLGVETGLPAIGVGKSRLCGQHPEPGPEKGSLAPLVDDERQIGMVVRTRTNVRPVYVSVGHCVSLETAVRLTLACTGRYRLPEPIRAADRLAGRASGR